MILLVDDVDLAGHDAGDHGQADVVGVDRPERNDERLGDVERAALEGEVIRELVHVGRRIDQRRGDRQHAELPDARACVLDQGHGLVIASGATVWLACIALLLEVGPSRLGESIPRSGTGDERLAGRDLFERIADHEPIPSVPKSM